MGSFWTTVIGLLSALGILSFLPSAVWATNAVCELTWQWSYNSKGKNPCEIAASLQGACFGEPNFEVQSLQPGNPYPSPQRGTPLRKKCGCNTVIFSLYMACTLCQNSASTRTWTEWSQFCDDSYVAQYPFSIPQNTTVPRWAYLDYTKENQFNSTFAELVGRDPETTPSNNTSATSPSPTTTNPSNGGDQGGSSRKNVGAIVGGIVGSVTALIAIATLLFFLRRKRNRKIAQAHLIDLDIAAGAQWETSAIQDSHKPQRLYDPSDPSTFPPPVLVDGESHEISQAYVTPAHFGKYTGSAEI